jgi:hypothetical protein
MSDEGEDDYHSRAEREASKVERATRRVGHKAHEAEAHIHDRYEGEREDSLALRVEKAADSLCLIFLVLWILSVWEWPLSFLADFSLVFFAGSLGFGYVGSVAGSRKDGVLFGRIATTSIEFAALLWFFLLLGWIGAYPYSSYSSILATVFIITLTASLILGGGPSSKWDRLSDRIGGALHSIALIILVFWFFGAKGILLPLGLDPLLFPEYLVLLGLGIYILGSVTREATFPIRRVALERVAYSIAWGCLGAVFAILILRWLIILPYVLLQGSERIFFLGFISALVVGVALSASRSAEIEMREREIKKTWWWERFSKPIRESALKLKEELGKLKLSDMVYVLPLGGKVVDAERIKVEGLPDTLAVPIMSEEVEVGAIYIGTGNYNISTGVKEFADEFDGEAIVFTSPRVWQTMRGEQKWLQAYPENIKNAGFETTEDLKRVAESKLTRFKQFGERTHAAEAEPGRKSSGIHIPGVNVEEGPGYERVRLPFIEVISGREGDHVSVGPLKIWNSGDRSIVRFGPFLAVDESVPEAIAKPGKILIAVTDRNREPLDIAALKDEIILRKGSTNLHVKGNHISLTDDGTSVKITNTAKEIRTSKLWLFVKPKVKAKLRSGSLKFKAFANGTIIMKSRTGEVTRAKDPAMALRLISQLDEMVDDLARAAMDKRELEELSEFFSKVDETYREKGTST